MHRNLFRGQSRNPLSAYAAPEANRTKPLKGWRLDLPSGRKKWPAIGSMAIAQKLSKFFEVSRCANGFLGPTTMPEVAVPLALWRATAGPVHPANAIAGNGG
jgi:hypothetical protein